MQEHNLDRRWERVEPIEPASVPLGLADAIRTMRTAQAVRRLTSNGGDVAELTHDEREALLESIAIREMREAMNEYGTA
jgi:hypothetical protein